MIRTTFSKRHKRKMYLLDIWLPNGKRFRKSFYKKDEAEAVAFKVKHDATVKDNCEKRIHKLINEAGFRNVRMVGHGALLVGSVAYYQGTRSS